jgi:hypothetical protein
VRQLQQAPCLLLPLLTLAELWPLSAVLALYLLLLLVVVVLPLAQAKQVALQLPVLQYQHLQAVLAVPMLLSALP